MRKRTKDGITREIWPLPIHRMVRFLQDFKLLPSQNLYLEKLTFGSLFEPPAGPIVAL